MDDADRGRGVGTTPLSPEISVPYLLHCRMGPFASHLGSNDWVRFSQIRERRSRASPGGPRLIGRSSVVAAGVSSPAASIDGRSRIKARGLTGCSAF